MDWHSFLKALGIMIIAVTLGAWAFSYFMGPRQ